jgi:nucleoid DNA-binding protein
MVKEGARNMATVTKKKLINSISQKLGIHHNDVRNVIQAFLNEMVDSLAQGNRLEFRDFGVLEIVNRKEKIGRNPKNAGVPIIIPARKAVKFTAGKRMRVLIEQGPAAADKLSKDDYDEDDED